MSKWVPLYKCSHLSHLGLQQYLVILQSSPAFLCFYTVNFIKNSPYFKLTTLYPPNSIPTLKKNNSNNKNQVERNHFIFAIINITNLTKCACLHDSSLIVI